MAKCKQCGAELNGAKFCPDCGAPANDSLAAQQGFVGADVRQRSLSDMEHMLRYFGAKKDVYDNFATVSAEVAERSERSYSGWIVATVISLIIGFFSKAVFFFIAPVAFVALFILLTKKNKNALAVATGKQQDLMHQLEVYYEEYGYCPVGLEYTKPETLQILYDLVRKGRASTPGDAINIYLADMQQEEMVRLQKEATEAAKQTAKSAKKAADYSAANFWFK